MKGGGRAYMKFCPECGKDARGSTKFCPECGADIAAMQEAGGEKGPAGSTRDLGTVLEDNVEKILRYMGYDTQTRTKIRGESGQLNEIDILAEKGGVRMAVECKNYGSSKVGIKELRDFGAKLADLGIRKGLFVTSSDFSQDARGWAASGPDGAEIDLWNEAELANKLMAAATGRDGPRTIRIGDCLPILGSIDEHSRLSLKNKENVSMRRILECRPYYVVRFNMRDECRTPDRRTHTRTNSGLYVMDAQNRYIMCRDDDHGRKVYSKEDKQLAADLAGADPSSAEVPAMQDLEVRADEPAITAKEAEFDISKRIQEDNREGIKYSVKVSRNERATRKHTFVPRPGSIKLQSKLVRLPVLDIKFVSKDHSYARSVLLSSETVMSDEISRCKHVLKSRPTFAVCETCGVAKCEDDIFVDQTGAYYCKDHASEELRQSKKPKSIKSRIGLSLGRRKK